MPAAAPVYVGLGDSAALLREMQKVVLVREGPFLLLTPTGAACRVEVETVTNALGSATESQFYNLRLLICPAI